MSDIVIAGYLGFGNSGDEALLAIVLDEIRKMMPGKTVTVLSMRPSETERMYGVRAVHRYSIADVVGEMKAGTSFVFGGGSLLQDVTSRRSLYYYLWLLHEAKRRGMKTMLLSNGIGPLIRDSSRRRTASVLKHVDRITLRDSESYALLQKMGLDVADMHVAVSADTAFLLGGVDDTGGRDAGSAGIGAGERYAVVSPRPHRGAMMTLPRVFADVCVRIREHGIVPLIVPMQRDEDLALSQRIARMCRCARVWDGSFGIADAKRVMSGAEFALGMRLHTLIFACAMGTPSVGVGCDPKITSFCRMTSSVCAGMDEMSDSVSLCRFVDEVTSRREHFASLASSMSAIMAERAKGGLYELRRMVESK